MSCSRLVSRNVRAQCGRTSMRLEPELWDALQEMSRRERLALHDLVRAVAAQAPQGGRTSAVRVGVLRYFRAAATEQGHAAAGHGD